jgi:predicted porin
MKKTLIALAAVAVAGAASAQVTLYGKVDLGYKNTTTKDAAGVVTDKFSGMRSGNQSGSRWGLKGTEDLGGGLKASFNYEASVTANTGAGNDNFARRSVLELSGGFGKIGMGRDYNPYFGVVGFSDVTGVDGSSTNNLLGGVRTSNMFLYTSPSFSGVTVKFGYSGNSATDAGLTNKTTSTDFSVTYGNGPVKVAFAQQTNKPTVDSVAGTKTTNTAIGATYDLGMAKVYFNNLSSKTSPVTLKETNLAVSVPMGAATLLAGYGRNSATGEKSATDYVFGADYSLSKMTNVYARVNKRGAVGGGKTTGMAVGLRHSF